LNSISFEKLSVDGTVCATFHEAAIKKGLAVNDGEYIQLLTEYSTFKTAPKMRSLFAELLMAISSLNGPALFERFFKVPYN